ncbi:MAG TPA: aldehyde dehydrogenase [Bacteriovoracaceae bacterium]|nr:aldehyde dehydrogenase [Bacteriovoracaceae bacterium]
MEKILNYIGGELIPPIDGEYLDNVNPATGKVYSQVPSSKGVDVKKAVAAAKKAFPAWSVLSPEERARYLMTISELITKNLDELALAETIDNGKPISVSKMVDIPRSAENFQFFAEEIQKFTGVEFSDMGKGKNTVSYSPVGVVGCISPWNLPLYLFTWKIAPALASGCTVVAKPSEVTPMTAYLLSRICQEAKLPPGVLNVVHGLGQHVGAALSKDEDIKAISFTGSTVTGKIIARDSAETMKRLHLEMGGKNPNIIFADCDFEKALETTIRSSFANQGQICLCGSRIFVERPLYEKFKLALIEKVKALKQENPELPETQQGAVVSKAHFDKIMTALAQAKKEGAQFLTGGHTVTISSGYFIAPTLIENLKFNCMTNQEEVFGPVATIMPFDTEDEVVEWANSTKYGLAGSIWSQDLNKARRVANKIDSGIIWINTWMLRDLRTPFGGMKESGRGREGGKYILEFFSNVKNICQG